MFHSYNKTLLKVFAHPLTITNIQVCMGASSSSFAVGESEAFSQAEESQKLFSRALSHRQYRTPSVIYTSLPVCFLDKIIVLQLLLHYSLAYTLPTCSETS